MEELKPGKDRRYNTPEKIVGSAALLAVLSSLPFQNEFIHDKEEIKNPILATMVKAGEVAEDCETHFSSEFSLISIQEQKEEVAFGAVYNEQGACQIMPLGFGEEAGVSIDSELLQKIKDRKDVVKVIFYHTHPSTFSIDEERPADKEMTQAIRAGVLPPFRIAPPSSDDYMTMARQELQKQEAKVVDFGITEQRVISPLGIWKYGIQSSENMAEKQEESLKLGSLFSYYEYNKDKWDLEKGKMDAIRMGYSDVAVAAYNLAIVGEKRFSEKDLEDYKKGNREAVDAEVRQKVIAASIFANAMNGIGYKLEFKLHPKYAK